MRNIALLISILAICSAIAEQNKFETTLTSMMNMGARTSDAVDSAL